MLHVFFFFKQKTAYESRICDWSSDVCSSDLGSNVEIRDEIIFRPEAIAHRPGLKPIQCDVWNSLVFISMNPEVEPLLVHLDVLPEHLKAYPFDKYRVIKDFEVCWDANWKTALDAFVEFYHADDVHPEVIPVSETLTCPDRKSTRLY